MADKIAGYGQNGPEDSTNDFNVRQRQIKNLLSKMSTAKIVQVVGVEGGGLNPPGTVSVTPMVKMQDGIGNVQEHGVIEGIPWWRLQGGLNGIICDPKVGDIGLLVCSDRDINAVKSTGKVSNPGSDRQFSVADGIYIGGLLNHTPNQYVWFTDDGIVIFDMNGNSIIFDGDGINLNDTNNNTIKMNQDGILMTPLGDSTTSISLRTGVITIIADTIVTHARKENAWDTNGLGYVYSSTGASYTIDNYTQGITPTPHPPNPPKVPI